ncbi:uncharacterized protein [Asterias amurensis]|uniref:uncharacterized protein n=1 Tax=Asterias amurensis TaxID=7602 RepID=UPI003AB8CC47
MGSPISPVLADIFQGKYYEQTAGTSMGSPISPVLADIFMEEFESSSLLTADLRPSLWLRYVDDTFVVWPHGQDSLHEFLQYLNQKHSSINFTMEQEHSGKLPFLDVLIANVVRFMSGKPGVTFPLDLRNTEHTEGGGTSITPPSSSIPTSLTTE